MEGKRIDEYGLSAARAVARWNLGDDGWAYKIISAYIDPENALNQLYVESDGLFGKPAIGTEAA